MSHDPLPARGVAPRAVWAGCVLATLGMGAPAGCADSNDVAGSEVPPETVALVEHLEELTPRVLSEAGVTGASIVVFEGGEPVWRFAYGIANQDNGEPVTAETRFNVGSISKVATAWGTMTAVESGLLDLDRPVLESLEQWTPGQVDLRWSAITPRLLLSHSSGLSFGSSGGLIGYDRDERPPSLPTVLDGGPGAKNPPLELRADPGERTLYSAAGYALLQALIEDSTGRPFHEHMEATVFEPLGMVRSSFSVPTSGVARGHNVYDQPYTPLHFSVTGAGGLYTTAEDLARLLAASSDVGPLAAGGGSLGADSVAEMRARQPGDEHAPFGLGFERKSASINGVEYEIIGHEGSNRGYYAFARVFPATGDGIVVVTNSDRAKVPVHQLGCAYLTWRVRGGRCMGPHNRPGRWSVWVVIGLIALVAHAFVVRIQVHRQLRKWQRPRGRSWWRPALALALVATWCVTLYTSLVAALVFGANDQIPYPYLDPGSGQLTVLVAVGSAWLAVTAWLPERAAR